MTTHDTRHMPHDAWHLTLDTQTNNTTLHAHEPMGMFCDTKVKTKGYKPVGASNVRCAATTANHRTSTSFWWMRCQRASASDICGSPPLSAVDSPPAPRLSSGLRAVPAFMRAMAGATHTHTHHWKTVVTSRRWRVHITLICYAAPVMRPVMNILSHSRNTAKASIFSASCLLLSLNMVLHHSERSVKPRGATLTHYVRTITPCTHTKRERWGKGGHRSQLLGLDGAHIHSH